uniref:Ig-like domain-containing protein n=1 Tax=Oryzias sinensis TaxID=183150 RepID=A0A8C7XIL6_9TELE
MRSRCLLRIFELFSLHLFTVVTQPMETPSKISLTKAELGDDVTLICSTKGVDRNLLSWFKYELGYVIETVGKISYETKEIYGRFNSSRFKIIPEADGFSLSISNVSKEDEGTYLCQAGSYLTMRFINGSHLVVKDPTTKQNAIHVQQSSDAESVFQGKTLNLQCSVQSKMKKNPDLCLGEHRVYWYQAGSETHADIIHATSPSCDDHGRKCVYNLSRTIQNSGVSLCAVLSCGQILFGEGNKVRLSILCTFCSIVLIFMFL